MNTFDFSRKTGLSEADGWSFLPLTEGSAPSYYDQVIENGDLTLAWLALRGNITEQQLKRHHFKRDLRDQTGVINSLPRLLLITDQKKWYMSKIGDERFTEVKFNAVLIALYKETEAALFMMDVFKRSTRLKNKLSMTLERLKAEIRKHGHFAAVDDPSIAQNSSHAPLPSGSELPENFMPALKLDSKEEELNRYTLLLHDILFKTLHYKQIQYLQKFSDRHLYVNPFYKKGELLVYVNKHFFKDLDGAIKHKPIYQLVDKYTNVKTLHPTQALIEKELKPGLLKVNMKLVNEYLAREPF